MHITREFFDKKCVKPKPFLGPSNMAKTNHHVITCNDILNPKEENKNIGRSKSKFSLDYMSLMNSKKRPKINT